MGTLPMLHRVRKILMTGNPISVHIETCRRHRSVVNAVASLRTACLCDRFQSCLFLHFSGPSNGAKAVAQRFHNSKVSRQPRLLILNQIFLFARAPPFGMLPSLFDVLLAGPSGCPE